MRRQHPMSMLSLSATLAAALCLGALVGCTGGAGSEQPATDVPAAEEQDQAAADAQDEPAADEPATDADADVPVAETAAAGTVEVGSFTFEIPQYWAGRVEYHTFSDGEGNDRAVVYLPGNTDAELAELALVPGEEPYSAGDIGRHMVGSVVDGNGNHVEVWTYNWPWLAANSTGPAVSEEELAQLVDLSTGGLVSLDGLADEEDETVNGAEYGFMAAELVPTVAFG